MKVSRKAKFFLTAGSVVGSLVGVTVLWKDAIGGGERQFDREVKSPKSVKGELQGQVAIVTGANSGLGEETAFTLAQAGAKVFMACRNMTKCEKARTNIVLTTRNKYVYCRECDLASLASVRKFVHEFQKQETRLDVLVNNAGVMHCPRSLSKDGIEMHWAVNHLGHFLLTHLLLAPLQKASPSRVIFLVNLDYRKGDIQLSELNQLESYDKFQAFNRSQLANMLLVTQLAAELRNTGVTVNAAYPGVVRTQIKRHMGVDKSVIGTFLSNPMLWILTKNVSRGAQTSLFLAMDPSVVGETGKLFSNSREIEIDPKVQDKTLAAQLRAVDKLWSGLVGSKEELIDTL